MAEEKELAPVEISPKILQDERYMKELWDAIQMREEVGLDINIEWFMQYHKLSAEYYQREYEKGARTISDIAE